MKKVQYKGFTIAKGNLNFTNELYTIKKYSGIREQYFGGADTIAQAKEKIDLGNIRRIY